MKLNYDNYNLEIKDVSTDDKVRFDIKYYVGCSGKNKYFDKFSISCSGGGIEEFPSIKKARKWLFKYLTKEVKIYEHLNKVPKGKVENLILNSDLRKYI